MTRCKSYYEKCEREGYEWCEKNKATVSRIDSYLNIVNAVTSVGVDKEVVFSNFSEWAARPLFKMENVADRQQIIINIAGMLKKGENVSAAEVNILVQQVERKPLDEIIRKKVADRQQAIQNESAPSREPAKVCEPSTETVASLVMDTEHSKCLKIVNKPPPANASVKMHSSEIPEVPEYLRFKVNRRVRPALLQLVKFKFADNYEDALSLIVDHGIDWAIEECESALNSEVEEIDDDE
jgi:hypothetical protein